MKRTVDPTDHALCRDLEELLEQPVSPAAHQPCTLLTGRIEDTHHPELPGRVLVRWRRDRGRPIAAWLGYVHGTNLRGGDRVLLGRPDNESQWLVIGVLATSRPTPSLQSQPSSLSSDSRRVRLEPGQRLRIEGHDGTALLDISGDGGELVAKVLCEDLTLAAAGRLTLAGRSVRLQAGAEGVDIRTENEVVVRGRNIRLN